MSDHKHSLADIRCIFCEVTDLSSIMSAAWKQHATSDKVDNVHVE